MLFLYINFAISDRDIRGYIAMLMDLPSLEALRALIREFIARVVGEERGRSMSDAPAPHRGRPLRSAARRSWRRLGLGLRRPTCSTPTPASPA